MSENSSSSYSYIMHDCGNSTEEGLLSQIFMTTRCLAVLPPAVLVLCFGYRRRSSRMSNSDLFTYNSAALQLLFACATVFYLCGTYSSVTGILIVGVYAASIVFPGEIILHILTCSDQYLAAVHPIIYCKLKHSGGLRIRIISIGFGWLLTFGWVGVIALSYPDLPYIAFFSLLSYAIISISFCSFSVLRVLVRPGPGKVGKKKERADKSKSKAFLTITAILGALLIYLIAIIVSLVIKNLNLLSHRDGCLILVSGQCFGVPCSLVLPLLYLRRARKL